MTIPTTHFRGSKKKLLVMTYAYPPLASSGVYRVTKFVQYLPDYGWEPTVLTIPKEVHGQKDPDLERLRRPHTQVHRAYIPRLAVRGAEGSSRIVEGMSSPSRGAQLLASIRKLNTMLIPDLMVTWMPFAISTGIALHKHYRFDAIWASVPPFSTALIAVCLSRILRRPVVLDFRDAWTLNPFRLRFISQARLQLERELERFVVHNADALIFTNDQVVLDYLDAYPFVEEKITVITNGFDPNDFIAVKPICFDRPTIVYTGMLDEKRQRSPLLLFDALVEMLDEDSTLRPKLSLRFIGSVAQSYIDTTTCMGIGDVVDFEPMVSYFRSLSYQKGAAGLILIGTDPSEIPGKTFDYLGACRPIYALAHSDGAVAQLLSGASRVTIGPLDDPQAAKHQFKLFLQKAVETFPHNEKWRYENLDEYRLRFTRQRLTEKLAEVLDKAANRDG